MADDTKPIPSTHFAISKQALAIIGIVGFMAIMLAKQFGWISDSQAAQLELLRQQLLAQQQYSTVSVAETKSGGTSVVTVETGGKTADVKPVVSAVTPDQIKQWTDIFLPIIKQMIQDLRPTPVVDPKPTPVDPIVTPPAPQPPTPSGMRLSLTDSEKNPITATSVPVNRMIRVMVSGTASKVGWSYGSHGNAEVSELPLDLGYDFILKDSTAYIDITVFDATLAKVTARISANQAPMPPPIVDPVNPVVPDGNADKNPVKNLTAVTLIYSPGAEPPYLAKIIGNHSWWANTYGSKWQFLTSGTKSPKGTQALAFAQSKGVNPPFLAVWSDGDTLVSVKPVPQTVEQIPTVVNGALQ